MTGATNTMGTRDRLVGVPDDLNLAQALCRPPWHVASTMEIAEASGISFGRLSNWTTRRLFVRPEPRAVFRVGGNRNLYRIDRVTVWLTGASVQDQALSYLQRVGLAPDDGRDLWEHVRMLEAFRLFGHYWRLNDHKAYMLTLRA